MPNGQRHWPRVRLPSDLADVVSVMLAARRLKNKDAYILIREALEKGLPDEYQQALVILRRFDIDAFPADDPKD